MTEKIVQKKQEEVNKKREEQMYKAFALREARGSINEFQECLGWFYGLGMIGGVSSIKPTDENYQELHKEYVWLNSYGIYEHGFWNGVVASLKWFFTDK